MLVKLKEELKGAAEVWRGGFSANSSNVYRERVVPSAVRPFPTP
jgi:hypothetical protein